MKRLNPGMIVTILLIVIIAAIGLCPTSASADKPEQVAEVELGGNSIVLRPLVANSGATLTISGPDNLLLEESFGAGVVPSVSIVDEKAGALPDGTYTYELRLLPEIDAQTRAALASSRASGDESIVQKLRSLGKLPTSQQTQTGSFTVAGGHLVDPFAVETQAKDVVHLDDVIITGSLCVGFDCINGESFGFDTLRLKENNLRLHFQDTSSSASFPTNDWRIIANDTSNGGSSYLAIEDSDAGRYPFRVEAGARSNALVVESDGDVGIGTLNPATDIELVTGNTPTLRLAQDGSSGFTPQSWDVAGNEANFFVRDVTNGSKLPFRIKPSAPTDSVFVAANGDVGIGTDSPTGPLHVNRSSTSALDMLVLSNAGPTRLYLDNSASPSDWRLNHPNNGSFRIADGDTDIELELDPSGNLTITGSLTAGNPSSTFPDYVFQSGYELMSLDDLSTYIETNRHLPNVPTAAATNQGQRIDMTKLQVSLLEKVEELTLYTIDQHQTIKELTCTNADQAAVINDLAARLETLEHAAQATSEE